VILALRYLALMAGRGKAAVMYEFTAHRLVRWAVRLLLEQHGRAPKRAADVLVWLDRLVAQNIN